MKPPIKEMITALEAGNEARFKALLEANGFDINSPIDNQNNRLTHFFAKQSNFQSLDILIRNGANLTLCNQLRYLSLDYSSISKDLLQSIRQDIEQGQLLEKILQQDSSEKLLLIYIYDAKYSNYSQGVFNLNKALELTIANKANNSSYFLKQILKNSYPLLSCNSPSDNIVGEDYYKLASQKHKDLFKACLVSDEVELFKTIFLPSPTINYTSTIDSEKWLTYFIRYCSSEKLSDFLNLIKEVKHVLFNDSKQKLVLHALATQSYELKNINNLKITFQFFSEEMVLDIDAHTVSDHNLLQLATLIRNKPVVWALLEIGVNIDLRNSYGYSAEDLLYLDQDTTTKLINTALSSFGLPIRIYCVSSYIEQDKIIKKISDEEIVKKFQEKFKSHKINAIYKQIIQEIWPVFCLNKSKWFSTTFSNYLQLSILKLIAPSLKDCCIDIKDQPLYSACFNEAWNRVKVKKSLV